MLLHAAKEFGNVDRLGRIRRTVVLPLSKGVFVDLSKNSLAMNIQSL
jgi:hypothetical protein